MQDKTKKREPASRGIGGGRSGAREHGFTLIELMIVCVIIAILAAIAYPSYVHYVVSTNRTAAEACLSQYANFMERFYTTNLRYDQTSDTAATAVTDASIWPQLNCASDNQTGDDYQYQIENTSLTKTTYTLQAVPQDV